MTDGDGTAVDDGAEDADSVLREVARATPEPPPVVLARGTRVGPYEVVEQLGRGGMGVVYRAVDTRLGRDVALKILRAPLEEDLRRRHRFVREARAAAAVNHPNVATVYEVGEAGDLLYIAMELVAGMNLRMKLAAGPLGVDEGARLAREIARGLASAHVTGVVHRDLKPENVMITADGGVKLVDFGLAKLRAPIAGAAQDTVTRDGAVMGTPGYMAHEQLVGEPTDARTDVYAFGIVMYEMITGARPGLLGDSTTLAEPRLAAIVRRCVAPAPEDRWADAVALVDALEAPGIASRRPARRRVLVAAAIAALAIAVAALAMQRAAPAPGVDARSTSIDTGSGPAGVPFGAIHPVTTSPEAIAEYRRAMSDLHDAVRNPQAGLHRAITLDPDFAAAHLRLAFATWQPASTRQYQEAVRTRDRLDARDLELLAAEEPLQVSRPPDFVEGERRFRALLAKHPGDLEVWLHLGWLLLLKHDVDAGRAALLELERLDPTMPATEHALGELLRPTQPDEAQRNYATCAERWPTAAACLIGLARVRGSRGECTAYFDLMKRVVVISPDDWIARQKLLESMIAAGRTEDEVRAEVQTQAELFDKLQNTISMRADLERALQFGAFDDAQADVTRIQLAAGSPSLAFMTARLALAEETGDEIEVAALLKRYTGYRATHPATAFDAIAVSALARHAVMRSDAAAALRDRWRAESAVDEWRISLGFDGALASTSAQAQDALARTDLTKVPKMLDPEGGLILGRILLLAGRAEEARARLHAAATTCLLFGGGNIETHAMDRVRAAFELGRANEALHDIAGACAAYQTVLDRWGRATPRSTTAARARDAQARLGCATRIKRSE
jgi:serine/threonine protein kinase